MPIVSVMWVAWYEYKMTQERVRVKSVSFVEDNLMAQQIISLISLSVLLTSNIAYLTSWPTSLNVFLTSWFTALCFAPHCDDWFVVLRRLLCLFLICSLSDTGVLNVMLHKWHWFFNLLCIVLQLFILFKESYVNDCLENGRQPEI